MTTVAGWDLSLNPGVARISTRTDNPELTVRTWRIASTGKKNDPLDARTRRITRLRNGILDRTYKPGPVDLIVIEGPTYGTSDPYSWDRAGLWHACLIAAQQQGTPVAQCYPGTVKKFATGSGTASKLDMIAAARELWGVQLASDDEADALHLAGAGAVRLRLEVPFIVTEDRRLSIAKCDWPARPERAR